MYKVSTNLDVNGRGWGLDFKHGVAYTERDDLARRLKSLGYTVEEEVPAKPETPEAPVEVSDKGDQPDATITAERTETATEQPEVQTTDDGKLACPVCGKLCGNKAALTKHMNKEHPQE